MEILDLNLSGVIVKLKDYEPINESVRKNERENLNLTVYDSILTPLDPSENLYVANLSLSHSIPSPNVIRNIRKSIEKVYLPPIDLGAGHSISTEVSIQTLHNLFLLGIDPDEVYEEAVMFPKISKEQFRMMVIQGSRIDYIKRHALRETPSFIVTNSKYALSTNELSLKTFIKYDIIPTLPKLLSWDFSRLMYNTWISEGSHYIFPLIKLDSNTMKLEIHYGNMLDDKEEVHDLIIILPDSITDDIAEENWIKTPDDPYTKKLVIGVAGKYLLAYGFVKEGFIQVSYNIESKHGIMLMTQEDFTYAEVLNNDVFLDKNGFHIKDMIIRSIEFLHTPAYYLYFEKYYKNVIEISENSRYYTYDELYGVILE